MSASASGRSVRVLVAASVLALVGSVSAPVLAQASPATDAGLEPGNAVMGWRAGAQRSVAGLANVTKAGELVPMDGVVGIDVASYQGVVDWVSFTKAKRSFVFVKATEGTSYRNPYFTAQFGGAKQAGMFAGAYHFANPGGKSGKKQAEYFVKHGGKWTNDGKTLPGVLDIEYNPYGKNVCYGLSKKKMVSWITSFVKRYKKLTKRDVVIYTTADWWSKCTGNSKKFSKTNPLWVARWTPTTGAGKLPGGWTYYTFWQYSATVIDQNRFSNNLDRLTVLATQTK